MIEYLSTVPGLLDAVITLVGIIALWIINTVAAKVNIWLGVQIEDKHLRTIHGALMTTVRRGIKYGKKEHVIVAESIAYVEQNLPDAMKVLAPSRDTLSAMAQSKIYQLTPDP